MSSFFEPPPPLPEFPPDPPRPRWMGAPANEVGRVVALNLMLARSEKAALWISAATVYTDGVEFDVQIRHRLGEALFDPLVMHAPFARRRRWSPEEGLDPGFIRLGIQFSDGRKATNIPGRMPFIGELQAPPKEPIFHPGGGGGSGGGIWHNAYWVWPLPPEGRLAFVCEWPLADIPETRSELDSALFREAASEAVILWSTSEAENSSGGGWANYGAQSALPTRSPDSPEPASPDDAAA